MIDLAPDSFGKYALTRAYGVVPKPAHLSFEEAATVGVAFLTAYYALHRLGRITGGERVLIHAAAGGVGQAAVQIAQHAGATIFATAGTAEKREFLKSQGVEHIFDSRTLDFAEQVLGATGGEGVDLVLNSLSGEAIPKSLGLLRPYGRFLEIGKTDIYQNRMLGLRPFKDNLSYHAIDMDCLFRDWPEVIHSLLAELMAHFESEVFRPLAHVEYPITRVVDAFRYMAQRKNIGKIVVSLQREGEASADDPSPGQLVRSDATYLLSGGFGGLGLEVAKWLAAEGARHLVLLGRRPPGEAVAAVLDQLRRAGTEVHAWQVDVADPGQVDAAVARVRAELPPLRGVVHLAGTLDDGLLVQLDRERLMSVVAPKVLGAWNLHQATLDEPLAFFAMFSSVASILGAEGQGNYAAANALLDALAHDRRQLGLPAAAINWGPWESSGMAHDVTASGRMVVRGLAAIPVDQALGALKHVLRSGKPQVAVMDINWTDALRLDTNGLPPLLRDLAEAQAAIPAKGRASDEALIELLHQEDPRRAKDVLIDHFLHTLAKVTGQDAERIDPEAPLGSLGLDSLMAIELKNAVDASMDITLPIAVLLQDPSVVDIAEHSLRLWRAGKSGSGDVAEPEALGAN